jgi:two-component system response regulator AtoC
LKKRSILIIDDEKIILESLKMFLTEKGYAVETASCAAEGREKFVTCRPDAAIMDIRLPDGDGLDLLRELKTNNNAIPVIIITAFHDMDATVKAIKLGATEYITKPIDVDELEKAVSRATKLVTAKEKGRLPLETDVAYRKGKIVGNSKDMKEVYKAIGALSENRVTVLIEGETGTGKELIARAIHGNSLYREQPFIAINCSAIVPTLLESELFGHEKGAFTGALRQKRGRFELAGKGTIFLDEVGDIPLALQAKLLRFLQEKEFERVGGEATLHSNARVIAATNRELWPMVQQGNFREDLYYRLSVATLRVPPLRARKEDIALLIPYLLKKINRELHKNVRTVEEKAYPMLTAHDWPGNVRELENVLTKAVLDTQGDVIYEESVGRLLTRSKRPAGREGLARPMRSLDAVERDHIMAVLEETGWHLGKTCSILGISRPTLRQKLKGYNLPGPV